MIPLMKARSPGLSPVARSSKAQDLSSPVLIQTVRQGWSIVQIVSSSAVMGQDEIPIATDQREILTLIKERSVTAVVSEKSASWESVANE